MIAGETEGLIARHGREDAYDNFLFFGKNKNKKTPEEKAAKKEKRQQFWSKVGDQFKEGGAVSNILSMIGVGGGGASGQQTGQPSDYEFNVGAEVTPEKKGIPTAVWIVGGVLVLGAAFYGYTQYQKNKQIKLTQAVKG